MWNRHGETSQKRCKFSSVSLPGRDRTRRGASVFIGTKCRRGWLENSQENAGLKRDEHIVPTKSQFPYQGWEG